MWFPASLQDAPTFLQTVRTQLREAQANELQLAFANAITDEVGAERYDNVLAAIEARYQGVEPGGE